MMQAEPWHEQDALWEALMPLLFTDGLVSNAPAEVDKMISMLGIEPDVSVLDLCCGVGRHSLELARRGFRVTGVDRTRAYLERASERAEAEGMDVEFIRGDMRAFCEPGAFDAAINVWSSFGYFEDPEEDRRVLLNVHRSLKRGGAFLIDVHGKETLARKFQDRAWSEWDRGLILQERKLSRNWSWIDNRWIVLDGNVRTEYHVSHRLYAASELAALLESCGFASTEVYGSLEGAPYDHTAKRLVVVARK
jgi:SAM-dependent methyltransferase